MLKLNYQKLLIGFSTLLLVIPGNAARITGENSIKEDWGCEAVDGEWSCKRTNKPMDIFDDTLTEDDREKTLAYDLAWVNEPSYLVGGYYSNDYQFTKKLCESEKIELGYQNSEFLSDGTLVASGNVEMMSCDQEIYGNNAVINLTDDFAGIRSLVMTGNVIAKQPSTGILIRTTEMGTNMNDGNYSTGQAYFRFPREMPETRIYNKQNFTGYIRGYATTLKKESSDLIITDGYITSNDPYDNSWKITGDYINIDIDKEMLYIKNGFFKIKDIPVMYLPYYSHPTSNKRRSGFLNPNFVQNQRSGWGVSIPYYFNLAANYDLLLQTVIWSERGIMENATLRYMDKYFQSQFEGSIVPYDFKEGKIRGAFTLSTTAQYENINANFKYEYVSDATYYDDFSAGDINLVTKTLLDRQLGISYNNSYVDFGITLLDYGIVNPIINLANIPYAKLPEVKFNLTSAGYTPDYLTLSLNTLNTYFYKSPWPVNPSVAPTVGTNVNTFRFYEAPKIELNLSKSWGYMKPSLELPIRYYKLNNKPTDIIKFKNSNVTSVLPIFNIDAGAYFDKDYTNENGTYTSTLYPRLFYTYIPYQNQTDIPLFDTSLQNEQYMQMFQVNRFTGYDRINNANQLTYAIEASTTNQDNGTTLASAKIGQMVYFEDRRVTLCQGNSACPTPGSMDVFSKDRFSPIMSSFEFQVIKNIYLSSQINYRIERENIDYQVYQLSYKDDNENIFNVSYNNIASDWSSLTQEQINQGVKPSSQETITLSTILNITDHWGIAALWNYNFQQKKISNAFAGFQYNTKSWIVRALWQSSAYTNQDPNNPNFLGDLNNTYMLEFEFKGLGSVNNNGNLSSRLQQINGYKIGQWGQN
ncbi:LPS assembly protein LptD [Francisella tularensis subsp. novicida]|nr:LPS assembly protein LptD [Francisella tularensis]ABK89605.1 organic solvent tolerance protein OstA [Francisella tularensis subsp. novicida U112]AJI61649.1 organic solvent tolerance family protein [Francisella tularensis subsp. novicida U112]EDX19949.1 organic solvent tolerance protein [Francisella tularensis subsp. novicida FTE]MBK2036622.1 LPS assembly protein LptD [Francisella tularensis subsp. novicida]MBK2117178.1 LPS assembly protein LptD [Francisella tularensis subsp. novicida]